MKRRIYLCDRENLRVVDIAYVDDNELPGATFRRYNEYYGPLVYKLTWSDNPKYLKQKKYK